MDNIEQLKEYRKKLSMLSEEEKKLRDLYLKKISEGSLQGPMTGFPSLDKPWLKYYEDEAIQTDILTGFNMYDLIKEQNKNNLSDCAIEYYGTKLTYKEFFNKVDFVSEKYIEMGIQKGDIVSICMPTTPETVYSIYALNKIGAICDMLDPRSNPDQLKYYLTENHSKIIMLCENYYKKFKIVLDDLKIKRVILTPISVNGNMKFKTIVNLKTKIDNIGLEKSDNVLTYHNFLKRTSQSKFKESSDNDLTNNIDDNPAIIVHSSGTTSIPKAIVLTNKNINSIAIQYSLTPLNLKPNFKFLSVIPAFASFGVVASINLPFYLSMENHLVSLVSPKSFYKKIVKDKINFTLTIPSNFKYIAKQNKKNDLSNLYGPGAGGYSVSSSEEEEINQALRKGNCPTNMLMGWGMSELSSTACLEFPECSKSLSSGVPLIKNTISIFEPDTDKELCYYESGEICVSGPSVMKMYLNNPEKTQKIVRIHKDGKKWLHSGDIGYMDLDGRVYPVDRLERMIIKGIDGFKIFPQQLEEKICTSKYVDSCVVVGYNDAIKGIVPKAYIVPNSSEVPDEIIIHDVKNICFNNLSIRAIPENFEIIEELPYTPMGKIDYKSLENSSNEKKLVKRG